MRYVDIMTEFAEGLGDYWLVTRIYCSPRQQELGDKFAQLLDERRVARAQVADLQREIDGLRSSNERLTDELEALQ